MKFGQNDDSNKNKDKVPEPVRTGPKLRNINDEKEPPKEEPSGADTRLKLLVAVLAVFIGVMAVKGAVNKAALTAQLEDQQKALAIIQAEALAYGITEDADGDLVLPVIDMGSYSNGSAETDSIEYRNDVMLKAFINDLLKWEGNRGYDAVRQTMADKWGFAEDSRLLTAFMPPTDVELNANMKPSTYQIFVLNNNGKDMSYFIICNVLNTVNGMSAGGVVGIRATIMEDGTMSDVIAQTLL